MNPTVRARTNELTLLAVMASVVMLFSAFTAAYLIRRTNTDWQAVPLPTLLWVNTGILLASSVTMERARRRQSRGWLVTTVALGGLFLAGQLVAWRDLAAQGFFLPTNPHSSFLYMLTAVHGVHVLGGIAGLWYAATRSGVLRLVAGYWHFVGAVWIYVLLVLRTL